MLENLTNWLIDGIGAMGYPGIFLLMAMESSIIPVPSELVMPPAGYLAYLGKMNPWAAILAGSIGSLVGAYANYFASRYLGRPLILKYGRYVLIPPDKFERIESFFLRHGEISTFIGRLLPVVRHLISIPAGLAGMNHLKFSAYTVSGAAIWCAILTWIGYALGEHQEMVIAWSHKALLWVIVASCTIIYIYIWQHRRRQSLNRNSP